MEKYDDMLNMSRPRSGHPRMQRQERAKIFAPFAALSDYDQTVHARDQVFLPRQEPTEHSRNRLDRRLRQLKKGMEISVVYFRPRKQEGQETLGEYITVTDRVVKVEPGILHLEGQNVLFDDLVDIRGLEE